MEICNAPLFYMNILKIKNQKSGGTLALFEKDSYLSVSESVSEKAKLIRGDPPKIALRRRGSPLKSKNYSIFEYFTKKASPTILPQNTTCSFRLIQ
jgi:hypothetical protein